MFLSKEYRDFIEETAIQKNQPEVAKMVKSPETRDEKWEKFIIWLFDEFDLTRAEINHILEKT